MIQRYDFWAALLWNYYEREIVEGAPFYLAADASLIRELLANAEGCDVPLEEAVGDFHEACLSLFERSSSKALVREIAFERVKDKPYSRVICLAVQQVLIVEMMLNDENFSEHSYFPRYRECLGLPESYEHTNPLGSRYFQSIWNTLETEIRAVSGASNRTVTFFAGSGRDLNRMLPFSQALFTTHDLTVITERAKSQIENADERALYPILYKVRNQLGMRAQRLITNADGSLRIRLCRQVQSYLSVRERTSTLRRRPELPGVSSRIVAYLDTEDLFDDTITVFLRCGASQNEGSVLEKALQERLQRNVAVFLVPFSDGYVEVSRDLSPMVGEGLLAITLKSNADEFNSRVRQSTTRFIRQVSNLPSSFDVLFCDTLTDNRFARLFGLSERDYAPLIELQGGILADGRSRIYLVGYPPNMIVHRGRTLDGRETVEVNGKTSSVSELLDAVRQQREFKPYSVRIGSDRLDFAVSANDVHSSAKLHLGYPIINGVLSPGALPIELNQAGLCGDYIHPAAEPHMAVEKCLLTPADIVLLAARGKRIALKPDVIKSVLKQVSTASEYQQLKELVYRQIEATRSVPVRAVTAGVVARALASK